MPQIWIGTKISSHLIPRSIWVSGHEGIPALELPVRDALDIERRWRKDVTLRNEARRYTVCCERMQGIAQDLALQKAIIPSPIVWPANSSTDETQPSALAYLAIFEFLRRKYTVSLADGRGRRYLKHDRVEARFHPPGELVRKLSTLLAHILAEPKLPGICEKAAAEAEVTALRPVSPADCRAALEQRHAMVARCVEHDLGLVDVFDVV